MGIRTCSACKMANQSGTHALHVVGLVSGISLGHPRSKSINSRFQGKGKQMKNQNRPLLAATLTSDDFPNLRYPLLGSPKLDGIRVRVDPVLGAVSRAHKPLPNKYLQRIVKECPEWAYLDGEMVVEDPTDPKCFNRTQSALMSEDGEPDFRYWIFDWWGEPNLLFMERLEKIRGVDSNFLIKVTQVHLAAEAHLLEFEELYISQGYEGMMLRSPEGKYKFGRSTLKEQILMKLKRFEDSEAVIIGFEPLEHNENEPTQDQLGYTKRSTHKANKVATDKVGNLIVKSDEFGEFSIGSGFDDNLRKELWNCMGKTVTFKYQKQGMKDKPRFPIFKGFRGD